MTAESLSAIAGVVLSLVFSYIPGVKDLFDLLSAQYKQLVMGAMLVVVTVAVFALACYGVETGVVCSKDGAMGVINILIAALVANQSVYLLTKRS